MIFETDEEPVGGLTRFAQEHGVAAASFTAIGAFSAATLGYFDWDTKDYRLTPCSARRAQKYGSPCVFT